MLELNRQEWVDVGHSGGLGFCLLGVLLKEETRRKKLDSLSLPPSPSLLYLSFSSVKLGG